MKLVTLKRRLIVWYYKPTGLAFYIRKLRRIERQMDIRIRKAIYDHSEMD